MRHIEAHVHLTVHPSRSRQVLLCLRSIAGAVVEVAEPEVAVGNERANPEFVGPGEGLGVLLQDTASHGEPSVDARSC
jgi:hypothetical protein